MRFSSLMPFEEGVIWSDEAIASMKGQTTTLRSEGEVVGEATIVDAVRRGEQGIEVTFEVNDGAEDALRKALGQ